jgi:hypothetical protein
MDKLKTVLLLPFILILLIIMGFHTFLAWLQYGRNRRG